ncbi:MAG: diacylglycerol/lipid kinase family protein [Acidimicrobiia bacterium]
MSGVVVIANPVASQFTGGDHRRVMSTLSKTSEQVDATWPSSPAATSEAAAEAARSGASVVVAMGGDGMVHHVAQGLVGTETALGIIPVGTTNVIARLLGVPGRASRAARLIALGREPQLLGTVRLTLRHGSIETVHHSLFACGFGMDALVVDRANADPYRKYRFGSLHYARTALGVALGGFPGIKPHIEVREGARRSRAVSVQVQFREVYTYFGKMPLRIAPDPPDPMIVLVTNRLRRRRIPRIVSRLVRRHDMNGIPEMEVWAGVAAVELDADPSVAGQADGEPLGLVDSARVAWDPASLRVIGSGH